MLLVPVLFSDLFGGADDDTSEPEPRTLTGTPENDTIEGSAAGEIIDAGDSDDGNDLIFGGAGWDFADGGAGNDTIWRGEFTFGDTTATESFSATTDADSGDVTISLDGRPLVVLTNPTAFDLSKVRLLFTVTQTA